MVVLRGAVRAAQLHPGVPGPRPEHQTRQHASDRPRSAGRGARSSTADGTVLARSVPIERPLQVPARVSREGSVRPRHRLLQLHLRRDRARGDATTTSCRGSTATRSSRRRARPGCDYLHWERRLTAGSAPTRLRARRDGPGAPREARASVLVLLRLQRLEQPARGRLGDDPARLRRVHARRRRCERPPVEVGYSQHEGAERAAWNDDKLERVGGTHPVVHPAAGSHANFYGEALYLGSSAEEGVGCDDTRGPTFDVRPVVRTIPSDTSAGARRVPLDRLRGPLGRAPAGVLQRADRAEPEDAVDGADRVVGGLAHAQLHGAGGRRVRPGRDRLLLQRRRRGARGRWCSSSHPLEFGLVLAALVLLVRLPALAGDLAPVRSASPRAPPSLGPDPVGVGSDVRRAARCSSSGSACSSCRSRCSSRFFRRSSCTRRASSASRRAARATGSSPSSSLAIGTALTLLGARARPGGDGPGARRDRRGAAGRAASAPTGSASTASRRSSERSLIAALVVSLLASSIFLIPIAVWLAGRWALIAPAIELEGAPPRRAPPQRPPRADGDGSRSPR